MFAKKSAKRRVMTLPPARLPKAALASMHRVSKEFAAAHSAWITLASVSFDEERGSIELFLADGSTIRMSTPTPAEASNVAAMASLGHTKVKFVAENGGLTVLARSSEWVSGFSGFPALEPSVGLAL